MNTNKSRKSRIDPLAELKSRLLRASTPEEKVALYRSLLPAIIASTPAEAIILTTDAQRTSSQLRDRAKALAANAEFICMRGTAYLLLHDPQWATKDLESALEYYLEQNEGCKAAEVAISLGEAAMMMRAPVRALERFREALELCKAPLTLSRAHAFESLGKLYLSTSEYPNAVKNLLEAIAILTQLNEQGKCGAALGMIGTAYGNMNMLESAHDYHARSAQAFEIAGDFGNQVRALANIARIQHSRGEYKRALDNARKAEEICKTIRDHVGNAYMKILIGDIRRADDPRRSDLDEYVAAYDILQQHPADDLLLGLYDRIGHHHFRRGDLYGARHVFKLGLEVAERIDDKRQQAQLHLAIADLYETRSCFPEALSHYKQFSELQLRIAGEEHRRAIEELQVNYDLQHRERVWKREIEQIETERQSAIDRARELETTVDETRQELCDATVDRTGTTTEINKLIAEFQRLSASPNGAPNRVMKNILKRLERMINSNKRMLDIGKNGNKDAAKKKCEQEWVKIEREVEKIHPGFRQRLFQHGPNLSKIEIRICCLTRLGLSTDAVAGTLANTVPTVRLQRGHARKKLGLLREVNFPAYIASI